MKVKPSEIWESLHVLHDYNINPVSREVYIGGWPHSYEDEEIGVDHQMACEFIRNMTFLENQSQDPIIIHMCTVGGDESYGMAMFDKIKSSPCHITITAYAHARSMSSVILQAADLRRMTSNCFFMIHHGTVFAIDTYKGAKSYMDWCERGKDVMMDIYTERCKLGAKEIEERLDRNQEWYLTAPEALEHGFIDEIVD